MSLFKRLLPLAAAPAPAPVPEAPEGMVTCPGCRKERRLIDCKECAATGYIPFRTDRAQTIATDERRLLSSLPSLDHHLRVFLNSRMKAWATLNELWTATEYPLPDGSIARIRITVEKRERPREQTAPTEGEATTEPEPGAPA